jgi:hypothetical protein
MIKGTAKTEAQYRAVVMDSSSSLKDFSQDRKKYYKKYILGEKVEDKDNSAVNMGRIVETLLMEPHLFDEKFYMSSCASTPTGLMLDFVTALNSHTQNAMVDGVVTKEFEELAKAAYADSGFKIKFDAVLAKFAGSDAEVYYNEMRIVGAKGLTVVTTDDVTNAERIVEELKNNPYTASIVNLVDSKRWQIFNQFQVEGYEIDGMKFKSMMDKVVVDHDNKTIQVYDLKCVWAVENFFEEYYLYRRAYIQAFLYHRALLYTEDAFPFDHGDYEILYPKFIVCDSTNYMSPLVYVLDDDDMEDAYRGFAHKHRQYPGVKEIITDLKWAIENDRWNISRKNHISEGRVKLRG